MGRLIEVDVDKLKDLLNDNKIELTNNVISIVRENYIPKDQYETRLKADMVAILVELQLEIEEWSIPENAQNKNRMVYMKRVDEIIQQKINALKENADVL